MSPSYFFIRSVARLTTTSESKAEGYEPSDAEVREELDRLIKTAREIVLD